MHGCANWKCWTQKKKHTDYCPHFKTVFPASSSLPSPSFQINEYFIKKKADIYIYLHLYMFTNFLFTCYWIRNHGEKRRGDFRSRHIPLQHWTARLVFCLFHFSSCGFTALYFCRNFGVGEKKILPAVDKHSENDVTRNVVVASKGRKEIESKVRRSVMFSLIPLSITFSPWSIHRNSCFCDKR